MSIKNLATDLDPQRAPELEGYRRLWASVVRGAVNDLPSTKAWFDSERNYIGSFRWCCDVLGLDPDAVRSVVRRGMRRDDGRRLAVLMREYNRVDL